jgi:hypothetical protein
MFREGRFVGSVEPQANKVAVVDAETASEVPLCPSAAARGVVTHASGIFVLCEKNRKVSAVHFPGGDARGELVELLPESVFVRPTRVNDGVLPSVVAGESALAVWQKGEVLVYELSGNGAKVPVRLPAASPVYPLLQWQKDSLAIGLLADREYALLVDVKGISIWDHGPRTWRRGSPLPPAAAGSLPAFDITSLPSKFVPASFFETGEFTTYPTSSATDRFKATLEGESIALTRIADGARITLGYVMHYGAESEPVAYAMTEDGFFSGDPRAFSRVLLRRKGGEGEVVRAADIRTTHEVPSLLSDFMSGKPLPKPR